MPNVCLAYNTKFELVEKVEVNLTFTLNLKWKISYFLEFTFIFFLLLLCTATSLVLN